MRDLFFARPLLFSDEDMLALDLILANALAGKTGRQTWVLRPAIRAHGEKCIGSGYKRSGHEPDAAVSLLHVVGQIGNP